MLTTPRSSRSKTEATVVSPREFKNSVKEFMRRGIDLGASNQEEFIPYAQERDSLGNLLAKRGSSMTKMTRNPSCPPGKMKTVPKLNFGEHPDPSSGSEFCFDNFRYQARVMHSTPKVAYKKLIKPLNLSKCFLCFFLIETDRNALSPCFRSAGRNTTRARQTIFEEFPGVGHYEITGDATHKATKKVIFTKELKERPMLSARGYDSTDFDLMRSYNNAYQRRIYVPDFTKQTNRETHYYARFKKGSAAGKEGTKSDNDKFKDIVMKNAFELVLPKEHVPEPDPRWRRGFEVNVKNLPYNILNLQEKFFSTKRKYHIHGAKLK